MDNVSDQRSSSVSPIRAPQRRLLQSFGDHDSPSVQHTLYRMGREDDALAKFRQLISEYPQSKLAAKGKQIVTTLEKRRSRGE